MFNYDLISVCETNLNDTVDLPEILLNDYSFETANFFKIYLWIFSSGRIYMIIGSAETLSRSHGNPEIYK